MFPVGALIGALAASRNAATPSVTRAALVQGRWVVRPFDLGGPFFSAIVLFLGAFGSLAIGQKDGFIGWAAIAGCGLLVAPAVPQVYGGCYVFDDAGIEMISPWRRKPRVIAWADLMTVRFTGMALVLRHRNARVKLAVPVAWVGFATLAAAIVRNRPEGADIDPKTLAQLTGLAKSVSD
jgi:hypothetical protein